VGCRSRRPQQPTTCTLWITESERVRAHHAKAVWDKPCRYLCARLSAAERAFRAAARLGTTGQRVDTKLYVDLLACVHHHTLRLTRDRDGPRPDTRDDSPSRSMRAAPPLATRGGWSPERWGFRPSCDHSHHCTAPEECEQWRRGGPRSGMAMGQHTLPPAQRLRRP